MNTNLPADDGHIVGLLYDPDQPYSWTLADAPPCVDRIVLGPATADTYHARRLAPYLLELAGGIDIAEAADRIKDLIRETRAAVGDEQATKTLRRRMARRRGKTQAATS